MKKGWIKDNVDWFEMFQHAAIMRTDELSFEDLDLARKKAYRALYLNGKWWGQNILHVIRDPSDFSLASNYALKIIKNYLFYKMVHSH